MLFSTLASLTCIPINGLLEAIATSVTERRHYFSRTLAVMITVKLYFHLIVFCCIVTSDQISTERFEIPNLCSVRSGDLILGGSVFQKKVTGSRPRCAAKCLENTVCISFNYHSSTGDCQLNNATILNDCSNVQPQVGYKHYETVSTFIGPP